MLASLVSMSAAVYFIYNRYIYYQAAQEAEKQRLARQASMHSNEDV